MKVGKPDQELIDSYESKRSRFQDRKNKEFYNELQEKMSDPSNDGSGKSKKQKIKEEIEEEDGETSTKELAKKYDTDQSYVSQIKNQV
ncbi:MAG: hypothetical protein ABEJ56_06720 [Candidatus Nanohaloarchaea archaeon]